MPREYTAEEDAFAHSADAIGQSERLANRLMEQLTYTSEIAGFDTTLVATFMVVELLAALAVHADADPQDTLCDVQDLVVTRISELRADLSPASCH
jgi:hypothetical protein